MPLTAERKEFETRLPVQSLANSEVFEKRERDVRTFPCLGFRERLGFRVSRLRPFGGFGFRPKYKQQSKLRLRLQLRQMMWGRFYGSGFRGLGFQVQPPKESFRAGPRYSNVTGLWQSVWVELVAPRRLRRVQCASRCLNSPEQDDHPKP